MTDLDPTRRALACGIAAGAFSGALPAWSQPASVKPTPPASQPAAAPFRDLAARPAEVKLGEGEAAKPAALWLFDGALPAPVLRVTHGDELRLRFLNATTVPVSLHWHGVRNVNAMDGVGSLTQPPVEPGGSFDYRFTPPDPGTFLVRSLVPGRSGEAAGRGLAAMLVVDEKEPPKVDTEIACLIQDWRLETDGTLSPFGEALEAAALGRLGNRITVNGKPIPEKIALAPGTRARIRLANGCGARILRIRFDALKVFVAAIDGQPTDTFEPLRSTLPFPPGTRYDLLVDIPPEAGASGSVVALLGQGLPLIEFVAAGEPASAKRPAPPPIARLPANKALPAQIRLQSALRRDVVITGGAARRPSGEPIYKGDPVKIWSINGAAGAARGPALFSVKRGSPVVLAIKNQTILPQPMHLHGHVFRLLHAMDDGWEPYWLDTLQATEGRTTQIAFVADNPGRWVLGSSSMERFDTGLWTWFEVT